MMSNWGWELRWTGRGLRGVAIVGMEVVEVVVVAMSVLVVLELSRLDDEVKLWAHAETSAAVAAQETSSEGEEGREQSSTKRERRCAAIGVAMAIVDS